MILISTIKEMQAWISEKKYKGNTIGFVPTMGFLHEGHLSLAEQAKHENDYLVMSIFVNPLQFGEGEDFDQYPKDRNRDEKLARELGADVLFVPKVKEMYPREMSATFIVKGMDVLCGASRPGHFNGVATVVMKLFAIVSPNRAYFGLKDAQQVAVIERLVEDYHLQIEIVRGSTVREEDGLAKSSRNVNLTENERAEAPHIFQTLQEMKKLIINEGILETGLLEKQFQQLLTQRISGKIDYAEIKSFPELKSINKIEDEVLIATAIKYSKVRLIDNVVIKKNEIKGEPGGI